MILLRLTALAIPATLLAVAQSQAPRPAPTDAPWATRVAFERHELVALGTGARDIRRVHPDLAHISGWISAVGAGVALLDADGDGLANDYCLVDPRFDTVTLGPVPTTGARYPARLIGWSAGAAPPGSVAPMGCLPGDFDGDGAQDLVLYYWGRGPTLHLAAEDWAERPLLPRPEVWHTNAALVADLDGDGALDLVFGNYFPEDAAILGTEGAPRMQQSMSRARNAGRNRVLRATGPGRFVDDSDALNAAAPEGWTLALGAADLDEDGLPELYIANDFGPDHLLHNRSGPEGLAFAEARGRRGLFDPRSRVLGQDSFKGMGVDFGDLDRDGRLDLFVSSIAEDYALMESHLLFRGLPEAGLLQRGIAPFEEISGAAGLARSSWSWDARFADFDGDGWPELLQATGFLQGRTDRWAQLHEVAMGNDQLLAHPGAWPDFGPGDDLSGDRRDALFLRGPDGRWHDAAAAVGLEPATVSRGIALGDVDGDGDVDALIARQWAPSVLLRNVSAAVAPTATLAVRVVLPDGTERPAHGARVTLHQTGGTGPTPVAIVPGGEGHSGKSAPEVHFGLGAYAPGADLRATIAWRDGSGLHSRSFAVRPGHQTIRLTPRLAAADPDLVPSEN